MRMQIMNCQIEAGEDVVVSGRFGSIIGGHISAQGRTRQPIIGNVAEVENQVEAGGCGKSCDEDESADGVQEKSIG